MKLQTVLDRASIFGVLLLSWGLLLWQLTDRSLWVDEFLTLQMVQGGLGEVLQATLSDIHPPLYFLALRLWTNVAGSSDFTLRWFSVAIGFLGLALLSVLVRRWISRLAVMPSMFLLALSPAFIEFSRMARYYSLLLTLGLLSTLFLLNALEHGSWRHWVAYTLTGIVLLYTFYPSGILLIAHGAIVISSPHRRAAIRAWCFAILVTGITFAPWVGYIAWKQIVGVSNASGAALARTGLGMTLGIAMSFYTFSVGETIFPWNPATWIGLGIIAMFILSSLRKAWSQSWQWALVFLSGVIFLSLVTNFVSVSTPFLNVPARGFFLLPYFLIVIATGLVYLSRRFRVIGMGGLLMVWCVGLFNYYNGQEFLNPIYLTPAKQAAQFVQSSSVASDLIIMDYDSIVGHYLSMNQTLSYLYTNQVNKIASALESTVPPRVWLISINRDQTQSISTLESVRQILSKDYRLEQTSFFLPIDPVYLKVKNFLLKQESYSYRLVIELYTRE